MNRSVLRGARYALFCFVFFSLSGFAQSWDFLADAAARLKEKTDGKVQINYEFRGRYEVREHPSFGAEPGLETGYIRNKLSMAYRPSNALKFAGTMIDSRAPWYGPRASTSARNQTDLWEAYLEVRPDAKTGFGMTFGRMAVKYGEGRLLSSTDWGNVPRSFDQVRAYWRTTKARFEVLAMSPVKVRIGEFDRPVFGERIWGTYNVFNNVYKKGGIDAFFLRREQNRPGGYTSGSKLAGTDKLSVNTFGTRLFGPIGKTVKYSVEAAVQTGKVGPAELRAGALTANVVKRWTVSKLPFDLMGEYRFASGTGDPADTKHSNTFDHLYPSMHNPFGMMDSFGWKNIHATRGLATLGLTKAFSLNGQFTSFWLANTHDSLYNASGKSIGKSAAGTAGRHVGVEPDVFVSYKYQHFTVGVGYGYLFKGEFAKNATKGLNPSFAYFFHTYSF